MYGLAASNPVVGRSFWDFLEDTSGQSATSLLDKYRVVAGFGVVIALVGYLALGAGKKEKA